MILQKALMKFESTDVVKDNESATYMQRFHSLVDPAGTPIAIPDIIDGRATPT